MPVTIITSNNSIPIEENFKISAGPGAGKTHWLVNQIKSVIQMSTRLGLNKRIACITYTNVAVETILYRLDFAADRVEVSTIHSFLYIHIVKPYISFIATEFEIDATRIDGHDDNKPSRSKITEWIQSHPNKNELGNPYTEKQLLQLPHNLDALRNWLASLKYSFQGGILSLTADNVEAYYVEDDGKRKNLSKQKCLDILSKGFLEYKKLFWKKGILHHDDVLYFSYVLMERFPFIIRVIQAKFPYFFLDEYQDTSPVQAAIINVLGQNQSRFGVIGDKAQAIFSFQGASPEYFERFTLPSLSEYIMNENRRSTNSIIGLLNYIRRDVQQTPFRGIRGTKPQLIVGDRQAAYLHSRGVIGSEDLATLCWDNISSNAFKKQLNANIPDHNLSVELLSKDSNSVRRSVVLSIIQSLELARNKRFKEAIKEMERNFYQISDKLFRKKAAFKHLISLLTKYDTFKDQPISTLISLIRNDIITNLTNLAKGAAKTFYDTYSYTQLSVCINLEDDNSKNRTIHKSKGDEFSNVFVMLKEEQDLTFLLNPNLNTEKHRIFYVALSRAKEKLFINVPNLSELNERRLPTSLEIIRLQSVNASNNPE